MSYWSGFCTKRRGMHDFYLGIILKIQNDQIQADFWLIFAKMAEFLERSRKWAIDVVPVPRDAQCMTFIQV